MKYWNGTGWCLEVHSKIKIQNSLRLSTGPESQMKKEYLCPTLQQHMEERGLSEGQGTMTMDSRKSNESDDYYSPIVIFLLK